MSKFNLIEIMESSNHAQTLFVAVDGSEASEVAYQCAYRDILREDRDHLVVGHISDKKKDYLPWNMKSHYIQDQYEGKLMAIGHKGRWA